MKPLVLDTNVLIRFLERGGDYAETFSKFDRLPLCTLDDHFKNIEALEVVDL